MLRTLALVAVLTVGVVGGILAAFDRDIDPLTGESQSGWDRIEELVQ